MFLSQLPPSADLVVAVFLALTGLTSVLGNGMVLLVYIRKRKKLRPPELLTVNLAICDFGFSLFGAPFFIISSLCHAWVFGESGCLWYGIQGFVFGIGSMLTTCLISVDRCLKICCLRYGQWIERRHVYLSIALVWVYTLFWALLPAFGVGSYGAEPYGTSCTINWWGMRSSLNDRIYIFFILIMCFGLPMLAIVISYLAILLTVIRSNRTLASISSSSVSHTSKDLKLAKMAAVVCSTFLLAWMPYAAVSLVSAILPRDDQEAANTLHTMVEDTAGSHALRILDIPSLLNWTTAEYKRQIHYDPESKWSEINNTSSASITSRSDVTFSSTLDKEAESMTRSPQPYSSLPPVVTLIPAMFAKSHSMINPFIYQIMNKEFRDGVYAMVFGQEGAERRQAQGRNESSCERSLSTSFRQSRRRSRSMSLFVGRKNRSLKKCKSEGSSTGGRSNSLADHISVGADALDLASLHTRGNVERHFCKDGWNTSSTFTV
ncbi:opsin 9 [Notolabrus celidotus]|uniref:opsin 9 n=1 Tax=Notolabrus celidotus TaxID=1203425 RepID=UPI00148F5151|nr:opsin 9 [Notolabrus celidotus]